MDKNYLKGLHALLDDDLHTALKYISYAIEKEEGKAEYYDVRSAIKFKLKDYVGAIADAESALEKESKAAKPYLRKANAEMALGRYQNAAKCFKKAIDFNKVEEGESGILDLSEKQVEEAERGARKAEAHVAEEEEEEILSDVDEEEEEAKHPVAGRADEDSDDEVEDLGIGSGVGYKFKHEYYQSGESITLTVLAKKIPPQDVNVKVSPSGKRCRVIIEGEYDRDFRLWGDVLDDESKVRVKVLGSKIEIRLEKRDKGVHWPQLEGDLVTYTKEGKVPNAYNSKKNWREVEKVLKQQEESEKPEGDAALNKLFQDIYSKASDETRRAMNKSFQTSGGTVLSTNWEEVAEADYIKKRTAPDGMEWKDWEGKKINS